MKEGFVYRWDNKYNQDDIYVGSTKNYKKREGEHRKGCHNSNSESYNKPFYKHVRKHGTLDYWKMTVIYKGPNFRLFEKNYIKSTWQYNLNDNIPLPTKQEKKDRKKAAACKRDKKKPVIEKKKAELKKIHLYETNFSEYYRLYCS